MEEIEFEIHYEPIYIYYFHRTILAALHFNYNLKRETTIDDNGKPKLKVHFPKYKYGEASVKECRIPQDFGKLQYDY